LPSGPKLSIDHALVIMLASLTLLGLGIFGLGIATGLMSGVPQLDVVTAAGTVLGAAGLAVAGGAAIASGGSDAVAAGARMAPGQYVRLLGVALAPLVRPVGWLAQIHSSWHHGI